MFSDQDESEFKRRLAETIAWCTPRASAEDPAASTRFPGFTPAPLYGDYPKREPFDKKLFLKDRMTVLEWRSELVGQLSVQRRRLLADAEDLTRPRLPVSFVGRILLFDFDLQLADGLSMSESGGFFDVLDTPGWDTWVWYEFGPEDVARDYTRSHLVAWVPPGLVDLAERGVWANPMDCLWWANDPRLEREPLVEFLRREGLA